ncbi:glutaredoxin domain-containing protein [Tamlana sp. 2201CG12-4]|uniref:glutaredoxin family protein n=1 Tax=Tamlana sp. 2201CG12-4 TaxID=3112582 RepID=UPI002DB9A902|nr:glutaredoxin domain-containing protein [Tamlana sp. 2201CG12-4]MEC3906777.1 glutaredoxin domain-containing protein [Tamlana sp. 2201CG12-4]
METNIKVYGAERCHKTQYYKRILDDLNLKYTFLDVETSKANAEALRNLYESRKLNFPTITIGERRLRNPSESDLKKWIEKLV